MQTVANFPLHSQLCSFPCAIFSFIFECCLFVCSFVRRSSNFFNGIIINDVLLTSGESIRSNWKFHLNSYSSNVFVIQFNLGRMWTRCHSIGMADALCCGDNSRDEITLVSSHNDHLFPYHHAPPHLFTGYQIGFMCSNVAWRRFIFFSAACAVPRVVF